MSEQVKAAETAPIDLRSYHPLTRLRWTIRAYVFAEGVLLALILGCLWFWFSTALDFCLHRFAGIDMLDEAETVRWIMMGLFLAAMTGVVVWYIVRRLFRDFRPASLAMVLEERFPELLGDRLITAIELYNLKQAERQGYSIAMIVQTMKDARERVEKIPVYSVFNWWRLALMAWSLVGVSLFLLLLVYPVSMLFLLASRPRGPEFWGQLALNAGVMLGLLFVFAAPFLFVRYRKRSPGVRWAVAGAAAVLALGASIGYYQGLESINSVHTHEYSWRLYHVADISLDRNLRFKETRWPRDEYFLEWLDFPVEQKQIQFNKTVGAHAFAATWIIADDAAPRRWRPLTWSDLPGLVDPKLIPAVPLEPVHEYILALTSGDERSPVGFNRAAAELPSEKQLPVDLVMAMLDDLTAKTVTLSDAERDKFTALVRALDERADDPKLGGRVLRKVAAPESVTLHYGNGQSKLRGRGKLTALDGRHNAYALDQPVQLNDGFTIDVPGDSGGSKEKAVPVYIQGEVDGHAVQTPGRLVGLVRPPRVEMLVYRETRPAYFYYLPPSAPRADTIDERRGILRGLRQELPEMRIERPAEAFEFPNLTLGSELAFTATADKKLRKATLTPRSQDFPGCTAASDLQPLTLPIAADGKSFRVQFAAEGRPMKHWQEQAGRPEAARQSIAFPLVVKPTTFDIEMTDTDNMPSSRSFTIRPLDDKPPSVNLYVDDLRQVQINGRTMYICTAKAEIPFAKESSIADDNGLHKVEFTYSYSPLANQAMVAVYSEMAGWLWASTPVLPNLGDFLYRREVLQRTISSVKAPGPVDGSVRLDAFDNAQGKYAERGVLKVDQLKSLLNKPLPEGYGSPVLKRFEFKESEAPVVFDLRERLPKLQDKDPFGVVPVYELTLNMRATDSNVIADGQRTAENKDGPILFRIVSEGDLYAYIAREEADLVRRFDEMINKMEEQQKVLQSTVARVNNLSPGSVPFEQTRVEGVMDAVAKSRELTAEISNAYQRILREYRYNRFQDKLISNVETKIAAPLAAVQAKEYPKTENELVQFHVVLKEGRPETALPKAQVMLSAMEELLDALRRIKHEMGDSTSFNKAVLALQSLVKVQSSLSTEDLKRIEEELRGNLLYIKIQPPAEPVTLEPRQSAAVKLRVRMPDAPAGDPVLRFEIPANSGLSVKTPELMLPDDATEATVDVTAGAASGTYYIKIIPSSGKPIDLKVIVK